MRTSPLAVPAIAFAFCGALLGAGAPASAATLSVESDKPVYSVGETISLSIVGDSEGAEAISVTGFLRFDTTLVEWISLDQRPLTSLDGAEVWLTGGAANFCLDDLAKNPGCPAFDQIGPLVATPLAVDGPLISMMTLIATAPGVVDMVWETDPASTWALDFFGLTDAPGTSFENAPGGSFRIVPEPSTALLLMGGLVALGVRRQG